MKRNNKKDLPSFHYKDIKHKCSICGLVSIEVDMSTRYKDYFCIECLKQKIIEG